MNWTPEIEAELVALWRRGVPYLEIARQLGCNKNMIAGRLHFLKNFKLVKPVMVKPDLRIRPLVPLGTPAELLDLDADGCRWAIAEQPGPLHRHLFCNRRRLKDRAYCEAHFARSVQRQWR